MENELVNKVQPNDIIAEQAVLGSMLTDKDSVVAAIEVLKSEDFYREDNKEIYSAMSELYGLGQHIDVITLTNQLKLRGTLEKVGDIQYISTLIDNVHCIFSSAKRFIPGTNPLVETLICLAPIFIPFGLFIILIAFTTLL